MGALFSAQSSNMGAPDEDEGTMPWFLQCDGHYIAAADADAPFAWFRLEGHGALYARIAADDDAEILGEWDALDSATVRLRVGGPLAEAGGFLMTATDGIHNTVEVSPEADARARATTFAFIDEESER